MAITASSICAFLAQGHQYVIDRRVISSYDFSLLRRNLLLIIKTLNECDDATEISKTLRWMLSEWITTPIPFDEDLPQKIKIILGEPEKVAKRWPVLNHAYEASLIAATNLTQNENPIRIEIGLVINELIAGGRKFRIYCHKNARSYFDSIIQAECPGSITDDYFIHKPKEYRIIEPFNVLIKVGPFRSHGWGNCPDALLTSPRFESFVHFIWSGSCDEPGFGLDPVTGTSIIGENSFDISEISQNSMKLLIPWKITITKTGDTLSVVDEDELQVFQSINRADEKAVVLLHLDNQYGILYPIRKPLLLFNPTVDPQHDQIGQCLLDEVLTLGVFLILPIVAPVDFGELHAKDGKFSVIWKKKLTEEIQKDHSGLCGRLSDSGINLIHLYSRLEDWCSPPDTVIPAPRRAEHFRILIDHLDIDVEHHGTDQRHAWWQYAWTEIRRSRGVAISEGRLVQDFSDENSLEILNSLKGEIMEKSNEQVDFYIEIPKGKELQGQFRFCRIVDIEKGFRAPDSALHEINDLREFEQWRD